MRKEYYNYVVKLPVLLHDLFRCKVADHHFTDLTVVMNHLVKSCILVAEGRKVSPSTRRILSNMERIPDMSFFFRRPEGYLIHTYVSNYQYVFLKETASAQRMSVEGMLTAAAELLVGTDGGEYHIPESLGRIAESVLAVRGSTLKDFRRQRLVSIRTNTIGPDRISSFMERHGITSAREFLRRVVLFFLEARYLIYRGEVEPGEDDFPKEEESDWEGTMFEECSKRDFVISTYSY